MSVENVNAAFAAAETPVVGAVGLSKTFRDFWGRVKARAVDDIDFEVRRGEVLGLLGPNGSGKSTTVKMLLGLLYPTAGRLTVLGKSPRDVEAKKRIGYLPEETYLCNYLTAMETLDFFGSLFNLSKAERRSRAEQLLDMVGLTHAKNRTVGEFSKGMARRIGLAQAMINDPEFLILDEPTSGLDPIGCREVKDLILTLKKRGKTVLVTSHLLSDVEDVCDRVVILYGGRIRAEGALSELLRVGEDDTLTFPHPAPDVLEDVLARLRRSIAPDRIKVDHPRMSLEDFFLSVVARAKAERSATSGADSGGKIAPYLTGGEEENTQSGGTLLSALSAGEKPQEEEKPPVPPPAEHLEMLDSLREDAAVPPTMPDAGPAPDEKEKLAAANQKLNSLLGGGTENGPKS